MRKTEVAIESAKKLMEKIEAALASTDKEFGARIHLLQYKDSRISCPIVYVNGVVTKYQYPFLWLIFKIFRFSLFVDRIIKWVVK